VAVESALHNRLASWRKHVNKVVSPSRFFLEKFVEWGWRRDQFSYIPKDVDASRFEPNFEPGTYFLYFGRMAPEKGVGTLLRAAAAAGVRLKLAGTGPDSGSLRSLALELGGEAEFVGFQSGATLHDLIRGARAVVLPSEWYENAPMSVLESFALGKPVVGASIGGIPEMIDEGDNGLLFRSGDAADLAKALVSLEGAPREQLVAMGKRARASVIERFNRQIYAQAMNQLYAELGVRA
jgi:glycosyltransferase involved in cell wall biosynthesis